jgi:hypothetical protein
MLKVTDPDAVLVKTLVLDLFKRFVEGRKLGE